MIHFELLALLIMNLDGAHSASREWQNVNINIVDKISQVTSQNPPNEETSENFCGWDKEIEVRKFCRTVFLLDVFQFNKIIFAGNTLARPMKKYTVKKSKFWPAKEVGLCQCPTTNKAVYISDEVSKNEIVQLYVNQDFISEKKMQKLTSGSKNRDNRCFLDKDWEERTACEHCAGYTLAFGYGISCCLCNDCCGKYHKK